MALSLSKSMVKRGLGLRRNRKLVLAAALLPTFLLALMLLISFLGTRSYNLIAAVVFAVIFGTIPFLAAEAVMLIPVRFLKFKLENDPTQVIELGCQPETAASRVWRIFAERKIQAKYLKHFTGHQSWVLGMLGAGKPTEGETIISFDPFFAISIGTKAAIPIASMYYEKDSTGLTLAETLKAKLKIA